MTLSRLRFLVLASSIVFTVILLAGVYSAVEPKRRVSTHYDKDLGWSSIPGYFDRNAFGNNAYIKINSQGFRNHTEFSIPIPSGKKRIICSGDSYTFGHGVSNVDAWPEQLSKIDTALETMNMGQKGYGIDQAYLWYLRDGKKFEHDVHLFGVIAHNFQRFGKEFLGKYKPVLDISRGQLRVTNVPVPRKSWFRMKWEKLLSLSGPRQPMDPADPVLSRQIALKIFDDLKSIHHSSHSRFVVLYFPVFPNDIYSDSNQDLRFFLRDELSKRGIEFLDLTEAFQAIPRSEIPEMYILNDKKKGIHYSAKGNRCVAELIYKYLSAPSNVGLYAQ